MLFLRVYLYWLLTWHPVELVRVRANLHETHLDAICRLAVDVQNSLLDAVLSVPPDLPRLELDLRRFAHLLAKDDHD